MPTSWHMSVFPRCRTQTRVWHAHDMCSTRILTCWCIAWLSNDFDMVGNNFDTAYSNSTQFLSYKNYNLMKLEDQFSNKNNRAKNPGRADDKEELHDQTRSHFPVTTIHNFSLSFIVEHPCIFYFICW